MEEYFRGDGEFRSDRLRGNKYLTNRRPLARQNELRISTFVNNGNVGAESRKFDVIESFFRFTREVMSLLIH